MEYLKNACLFKKYLIDKILEASYDKENEWFFPDGAFDAAVLDADTTNTWYKENFVVIYKEKLVGYIEGFWNRPLDIISSLRIICFDKSKGLVMTKACFNYFDYLFMKRGCQVINWTVAEKNVHAKKIYDKFVNIMHGRCIGKRSRGQKSYFGEFSDIYLYEVTKENYFEYLGQK